MYLELFHSISRSVIAGNFIKKQNLTCSSLNQLKIISILINFEFNFNLLFV